MSKSSHKIKKFNITSPPMTLRPFRALRNLKSSLLVIPPKVKYHSELFSNEGKNVLCDHLTGLEEADPRALARLEDVHVHTDDGGHVANLVPHPPGRLHGADVSKQVHV